MPRAGLILAAVFAAGTVALAQTPPPPSTTPGLVPAPAAVTSVDPVLKGHLDAWEQKMKGIVNYATNCTLVRKNTLYKKESTYTGAIWCLKPNRARMTLDRVPPPGQKPNPDDKTSYICTGQEVYEYEGLAKQLTVFRLPNGGVGENLLLEFMSGSMSADGVIRRFDLSLLQTANNPDYVLLRLKPRLGRDQAEFETMVLALYSPTGNGKQYAYMPRTVVIRKANGQEEEHWDFPSPPRVDSPDIRPEHFQPVQVPKEWKVERRDVGQGSAAGGSSPQPGQPRIARPTSAP